MESKLVDRISVLQVSNSESCFQDDDQTEKPMKEFQEEPQSTPSSDHNHDHHDHQENPKKEETPAPQINIVPDIKTPSKECKPPSSREEELISNEDDVALDDENDGFKTPTSSEHKIPQLCECPPAPRKPKPLQKTRVLPSSPSSATRGRKRIDDLTLQQMEAWFAPIFLLPDFHGKIKKAKRDHQ